MSEETDALNDMYETGDEIMPETEFDKMLTYHHIDEKDWEYTSNNERRNLWWNYRNVGKSK